jgi:hypothetical protein
MPQLVPPHAATVRPRLRLDRKRFLDLSIEGEADTDDTTGEPMILSRS